MGELDGDEEDDLITQVAVALTTHIHGVVDGDVLAAEFAIADMVDKVGWKATTAAMIKVLVLMGIKSASNQRIMVATLEKTIDQIKAAPF